MIYDKRRMLCKGLKLTILIFSAVLARASNPQETATIVGYIDSFSGSPDQFDLIRGVNSVPEFGVRTRIMQGDFIHIKKPGETATIRFNDNTTETLGPVAALYGPYIERGNATTKFDNLISSLVNAVSDIRSQPTQVVTTASRGDYVSLTLPPAFHQSSLVLAAGQRRLYLRWTGGVPPFDLRVTPENGAAELLISRALDDHESHSEPVNLRPGNYTMEISDARTRIRARLQVVPASELPDRLATPNVPHEVGEFLNAYALAIAPGGIWVFEAQQRMAQLSEQGYAPATLIREQIESGEARYWYPVSESGCQDF